MSGFERWNVVSTYCPDEEFQTTAVRDRIRFEREP